MKKFLAILSCVLVSASFSFAGEFPDISITEMKEVIKSGKVTVIDVMGTGSYKKGHVPGAIDFKANADKLESLLPKDKGALIVAYCGGPSCNAYKSAAKAAEALGYTNVKHMSAGISGWLQAGEKTDKG
ncbi:MAG: rhodanese-like domain-containing protein [Verrucomicrobiales bacterium]|nr:rhodanese-like domain-containing protein [Verrucomicrobiales bacterium]